MVTCPFMIQVFLAQNWAVNLIASYARSYSWT